MAWELNDCVTLSDVEACEEALFVDGSFGTYDPEEIDDLINDLSNSLSFDSYTDKVLFEDGLRKGVILGYMRYADGLK